MASVDAGAYDRACSGGPSEAYKVYTEELCLPRNVCYDFTIYDSYGDGLCCSYGEGSYKVYVDHQLIHSGGEFTYSETTSFGEEECTPQPTPSPSVSLMPSEG